MAKNPFSLGIWKKFLGMENKKPAYGPSNPAPGAGTSSLQTIKVNNAKSWNKETHPNGKGPSQLVDDIIYDANSKELIVTYRNGFTAKYSGITEQEANDFASADSKGRWALNNLWNKPYTEVN